jgi:hypothetical protein
MANNNSPFGFIGSLIAEQENQYGTYTVTSAYGTSLYFGDPVKVSGSVNGLANLVIADAGDVINGFFTGVEYSDASGYRRRTNYWLAGTVATNILAYVADNPFTRFRVQMSGAFTSAGVGETADFVAGSGSTVSGSGYTLDSTTLTTGYGFLVTNVFQSATNAVGSYAIVEVVPRLHAVKSTAT